MPKVGLFFGSFNPVHHGHLMMASYLLAEGDLDQLRFVLTPHNPHKERRSLADDYDRLDLLHLALKGYEGMEVSDIEFHLPKPSYTIDTLTYLREREPDTEFVLIIGGDNLQSLPKWKHYEQILRFCEIYVYRRPGSEQALPTGLEGARIRIFEEAPRMEISSTYLRQRCRQGLSLRFWVPDAVAEAIDSIGMYQH